MFFIQMSGTPGSGKSTLSRQIAKKTGAVVIDHDIVKSALLKSIENNSSGMKNAGQVSYNIDWSLIDFYLSQGYSVIFDSPCLYQEMIDKGTGLAKKHNVKYKYVECYLDDFQKVNYRLKNRKRMISQIREINSEESFKLTIEKSKRPSDLYCLVIDTDKPIECYIDKVIKYVNE